MRRARVSLTVAAWEEHVPGEMSDAKILGSRRAPTKAPGSRIDVPSSRSVYTSCTNKRKDAMHAIILPTPGAISHSFRGAEACKC